MAARLGAVSSLRTDTVWAQKYDMPTKDSNPENGFEFTTTYSVPSRKLRFNIKCEVDAEYRVPVTCGFGDQEFQVIVKSIELPNTVVNRIVNIANLQMTQAEIHKLIAENLSSGLADGRVVFVEGKKYQRQIFVEASQFKVVDELFFPSIGLSYNGLKGAQDASAPANELRLGSMSVLSRIEDVQVTDQVVNQIVKLKAVQKKLEEEKNGFYPEIINYV